MSQCIFVSCFKKYIKIHAKTKQAAILLYIFITAGPVLAGKPSSSATANGQYKILGEEQSLSGTLIVEELLQGLKHPWSVTWFASTAGQKGMLLSERNGALWVYQNQRIYAVAGIPKNVLQQGQGGYLGLYYWPKLQRLFLSYTMQVNNRANTLALLAFNLEGPSSQNNSDSQNPRFQATNLQAVYQAEPALPSVHHYGGVLTADATTLYLSLGDRHIRSQAQDAGIPWGSIIRLRPISANPSGLPVKISFTSEVFSIGHRNPQGLFYDKLNQRLWSNEHGPMGGDELNLIEAGKNYGWPVITYGKEYGSGQSIGEGTHKAGMEQPVQQWTPSPALSGLWVVQGSKAFPSWEGNLLQASLKYQRLYRLKVKSRANPEVSTLRARSLGGPKTRGKDSGTSVQLIETLLTKRYGRLRWVGQGPDGYIYLLSDSSNAKLLRLRPKPRA